MYQSTRVLKEWFNMERKVKKVSIQYDHQIIKLCPFNQNSSLCVLTYDIFVEKNLVSTYLIK